MRRLSLILMTLSVALLTACGGDDSAQKPPPGSPENPLQALPNPAPTRVPPTSEAAIKPDSSERASARAPTVVEQQQRVQRRNERTARTRAAKGGRAVGTVTGGNTRKQKAQAPSAARPCSLVSKMQARAIIGVAILEPRHAPQGPTCIYESRAGKTFITLTVQTTSFARLEQQVRQRRKIAVAERRGVCGRFGRPMLYLPLNRGRVLTVAGPCDVATRFAAEAVPKL